MTRGKEVSGVRRVDTIIGKDFVFKGTLEANSGAVRVDGFFDGDMNIGGDLLVGDTGKVSGNVVAKNITIAGEVIGNIESRGKLELLPTARVTADVKMQFLLVEDGAFLQGQCEPLARGDMKERGLVFAAASDE